LKTKRKFLSFFELPNDFDTGGVMGRMICEGCISIDVRDLARRGFLKRVGLIFPLSWTRAGEPYDHASVHVETDSVVLFFRFQSTGKWIDALSASQ
jgi:hypothetical protein